ncbi:MAG: YhcH/YjgK/YiaL family protein [Clostridia bacterium]|nr:YhcH/YjgK/YiaL family protein [Clostridia bacterium]
MIFDSINYIDNYKSNLTIYKVLKFLKETDFTKVELGKYAFEGNDIYYMVQQYETKADKPHSEVHQEYIDIQYIVSGKETIGIAPIDCEKTLLEVKEGKDCWLYSCETQPIILNSGDYMILYPNEIHKPGVAAEKPSEVLKVVVKIKKDLI